MKCDLNPTLKGGDALANFHGFAWYEPDSNRQTMAKVILTHWLPCPWGLVLKVNFDLGKKEKKENRFLLDFV